jgi:hypothetical protein
MPSLYGPTTANRTFNFTEFFAPLRCGDTIQFYASATVFEGLKFARIWPRNFTAYGYPVDPCNSAETGAPCNTRLLVTAGNVSLGNGTVPEYPHHVNWPPLRPPGFNVTAASADVTAQGNVWYFNYTIHCCPPGCTHSKGYWKTHHCACPRRHGCHKAPCVFRQAQDVCWPRENQTDPTLVEETFLCNSTWLAILQTPPMGNAWYTLAHQYIAARLNEASGAYVPPEVAAAMAAAQDQLEDCVPYVGNETLKDILEAYNVGDIGPGHCCEDEDEDGDDDDEDDDVLPFPIECALPLKFWRKHPEAHTFDTQNPTCFGCNMSCSAILLTPLPKKNDPIRPWYVAAQAIIVFELNRIAGAFPDITENCTEAVDQAIDIVFNISCVAKTMTLVDQLVVQAILDICIDPMNSGEMDGTRPCSDDDDDHIASMLSAEMALLRQSFVAAPRPDTSASGAGSHHASGLAPWLQGILGTLAAVGLVIGLAAAAVVCIMRWQRKRRQRSRTDDQWRTVSADGRRIDPSQTSDDGDGTELLTRE